MKNYWAFHFAHPLCLVPKWLILLPSILAWILLHSVCDDYGENISMRQASDVESGKPNSPCPYSCIKWVPTF